MLILILDNGSKYCVLGGLTLVSDLRLYCFPKIIRYWCRSLLVLVRWPLKYFLMTKWALYIRYNNGSNPCLAGWLTISPPHGRPVTKHSFRPSFKWNRPKYKWHNWIYDAGSATGFRRIATDGDSALWYTS